MSSGEGFRPITHRIERRKQTLRVVVEVDLEEGIAHLDGSEADYRRRVGEYLHGVADDILDVLRIVSSEQDFEVGRVKWFREDLGYGRIITRERDDVFVHWRGIAGDGYKTLEPGQRVRFKRRKGRETIEAYDVSPTDDRD